MVDFPTEPIDQSDQFVSLRNRVAILESGPSLLHVWRLVYASGVQASVVGPATETVLATLTLPATAMGPSGQFRLTFIVSASPTPSPKTIRVRVGGTGILGQIISTDTMLNDGTRRIVASIQNRNSQSVQITDTGETIAIDTTVPQTIVITAQTANSTDIVTREAVIAETIYTEAN